MSFCAVEDQQIVFVHFEIWELHFLFTTTLPRLLGPALIEDFPISFDGPSFSSSASAGCFMG